MKYSHKVITCYIGIVFITSGFYIYFKNLERKRQLEAMREGMISLDDIGNFFSNFPNMISNALSGPLQPIINLVNEIEDFFSSIPRRLQNVNNGFEDIGRAFLLEFKNLGASLEMGYDDISGFFALIPTVFPFLGRFFTQYIGPRIMCGVKKVGNFRYCFLYYILEIIGQTIYSIWVRLPLFLILTLVGIDLMPYVDMIWEFIDCIDIFFYSAIGFHIFRWSDDVMDRCFECRGLQPLPEFPTKPFNDQISKIDTDFSTTIPNLLKQPADLFKRAGSDFQAVFN